jgi:hypothetical protein
MSGYIGGENALDGLPRGLNRETGCRNRPDLFAAGEFWLSGQGVSPGWRSYDSLSYKYHQMVYEWLLHHAEGGEPLAQYLTGRCLDIGMGVDISPFRALKYYRLAAHGGDARAQNELGRWLEEGIGGPTDPWLSAAQGDPQGHANLQRCLDSGVVVLAGQIGKMRDSRQIKRGQTASVGRGLFSFSEGCVRISPGVVIIPGGLLRGLGAARYVRFDGPCEVRMIAEFSFYGTGLRTVDIPSSVEVVGFGAFGNCHCLESVVLHFGMRVICGEAFWGTPVRSITIPRSVRIIEDWAFAWCEELESVIFIGETPVMGETAFEFTAFQRFRVANGRGDKSMRCLNSDIARVLSKRPVHRRAYVWEFTSLEDALGGRAAGPKDWHCAGALCKGDELARAGRHKDAYRMYVTAICGLGRTELSRALTFVVDTGLRAFLSVSALSSVARLAGLFKRIQARQLWCAADEAAQEMDELVSLENEQRARDVMRRTALFWRLVNGSRDVRTDILEMFDRGHDGRDCLTGHGD